MVVDAAHTVPVGVEHGCSLRVGLLTLRLLVDIAIELDDQPMLDTGEIGNETEEAMLTAKREAE